VTTVDRPTPAPAAGGRGVRDRGPGRIARSRTYFREVIAELRKVIRPSRQQLVTYTIVVLVFVTFMVTLVSGLDVILTKGVLALFG
jgi:preprotein translocase subunit SecE